MKNVFTKVQDLSTLNLSDITSAFHASHHVCCHWHTNNISNLNYRYVHDLSSYTVSKASWRLHHHQMVMWLIMFSLKITIQHTVRTIIVISESSLNMQDFPSVFSGYDVLSEMFQTDGINMLSSTNLLVSAFKPKTDSCCVLILYSTNCCIVLH